MLQQVYLIREQHRAIGTKKLYGLLEPFMLEHGIKMGRDAFFDLLRGQGLLIRRRKSRKLSTTDSSHPFRKHPCLIEGLELSQPNQLWVADLTYWKVNYRKFLYISLLTDAYSRKVVGYHVDESMEASETAKALQMALEQTPSSSRQGLIHHSDRGVQYCSQQYVGILNRHNIAISMYQKDSTADNNIAERMNGILKNEYLKFRQVNSLGQAQHVLEECIDLYNQKRPHDSIGRNTPSEVHEKGFKTVKLWKDYSKKTQQADKPCQE